MAINLRLAPEAEEALRERAAITGRSQQELLRAAVDALLERHDVEGAPSAASESHQLISRGRLHPARVAYRRPVQRYTAPNGGRSSDALDRDERL
ncbi:ribbon-helix-helix protein, CopG family [Quadrisphaera granulorum]|nr:ribbon-helix-helix protein, CopG family [Quadrisphaera granulorum]